MPYGIDYKQICNLIVVKLVRAVLRNVPRQQGLRAM